MDINKYIESGILEFYALGLLSTAEAAEVDRLLSIYNELGEELEKIYIALENYAILNAIEPPIGTDKELLDRIENASREEKMDPAMLPLISPHSDFNRWAAFTKPILKELKPNEERWVEVLTHTKDLTQLLLSSSTDFDEEIHHDENESFLIISGEALCMIGGSSTLMGPGDFMAIPLNVPHSVKLISPVVTAILQRQKA
jgi:mannose-6-phosphate isomerase-like protein (cupin superfamily)